MTSDIPCGLVAFQGLRLSFTRSLRCKRNHSGIEHSEQSCCRSYRDDQIESLEDASISNMYGEHDSWQIVARADAEGHQSIAELEKMVKDFKQGSSKYFPWTPRDDDSEEKQYNLKNCLKWCQGLQIVNVEDADPCEACGMPV
ncbi:uncharacterized protein L201_002356 [Kwoniella dendrophila CBS 6074]|uniref:Uncharacterized protein n=1 Tax=Kwoniella dendrophila CBS 6074 TaxID=1295534 RepID=A0AAX4JQ25_9TREE